MSTVKITKGDFSRKVEEGWKRDQLAEHYGITSSDVSKILKQLGLRIRKFHTPRFELVDDEQSIPTQVEDEPKVETKVEEKVENTPELQPKVETEAPEAEPAKRKRRTKAEIAAEKFAETLKSEETTTEEVTNVPVPTPEVVKVEETPTQSAVWSVAPATEEEAEEVSSDEIIVDVSKATENIETSFNIPSGATATQGTEDDHVNAPPIDEVNSSEENPFTKAWGTRG